MPFIIYANPRAPQPKNTPESNGIGHPPATQNSGLVNPREMPNISGLYSEFQTAIYATI